MKFASVIVLALMAFSASAQVSEHRLLNAGDEPQNWLTYSGTYRSQRYSTLNQITPLNVKNLEMKWVFQADSVQKMEATPLVVDGVMYVTQPPDDIVSMDAKSGRVYWMYHYAVPPEAHLCCGLVNRGLAILGNTLYMGTVDGHLVAVDAKDGHLLWDIARRRQQIWIWVHRSAARSEGQSNYRGGGSGKRDPRICICLFGRNGRAGMEI